MSSSDPVSATIFKAVEAALETAEGMHGPDGADYEALMQRIIAECQRRKDNYRGWRIEHALEKLPAGFYVSNTGGGCQAFRCLLETDGYILLTDDDAQLPIYPGTKLVVGLYDREDEPLHVVHNCGSLAEVAVLCDHWIQGANTTRGTK